jgi:cytochrome c oxidase subunit 4
MTESKHHDHGEHGAHGLPLFQLYMVVAVALGVFTAASFGFNWLVHHQVLSALAGFLLILIVAVCKAGLVGTYFMHLKWDWSKLFFFIVPAFILGTMMMIVLLPDIVLAWGPP